MYDRNQEIARLRTIAFLVQEALHLSDGDQAICQKLKDVVDIIAAQLVDGEAAGDDVPEVRSDPDLI